MKNIIKTLFQNILLTILIHLSFSITIFSQSEYPDWTYEMKVWLFDVLYPFETGFARINEEVKTSEAMIWDQLNTAQSAGARL